MLNVVLTLPLLPCPGGEGRPSTNMTLTPHIRSNNPMNLSP